MYGSPSSFHISAQQKYFNCGVVHKICNWECLFLCHWLWPMAQQCAFCSHFIYKRCPVKRAVLTRIACEEGIPKEKTVAVSSSVSAQCLSCFFQEREMLLPPFPQIMSSGEQHTPPQWLFCLSAVLRNGTAPTSFLCFLQNKLYRPINPC